MPIASKIPMLSGSSLRASSQTSSGSNEHELKSLSIIPLNHGRSLLPRPVKSLEVAIAKQYQCNSPAVFDSTSGLLTPPLTPCRSGQSDCSTNGTSSSPNGPLPSPCTPGTKAPGLNQNTFESLDPDNPASRLPDPTKVSQEGLHLTLYPHESHCFREHTHEENSPIPFDILTLPRTPNQKQNTVNPDEDDDSDAGLDNSDSPPAWLTSPSILAILPAAPIVRPRNLGTHNRARRTHRSQYSPVAYDEAEHQKIQSESTAIHSADIDPLDVLPCLQCSTLNLSCSQTYPTCSRCARRQESAYSASSSPRQQEERTAPCLARIHVDNAIRFVRLETDSDGLWAVKVQLAVEIRKAERDRTERQNCVVPLPICREVTSRAAWSRIQAQPAATVGSSSGVWPAHWW